MIESYIKILLNVDRVYMYLLVVGQVLMESSYKILFFTLCVSYNTSVGF